MEGFNILEEDLQFRFPTLDIALHILREDDRNFVCFYANTIGERDYREFSYELEDAIDWVRQDVAYRISKAFHSR